MRTAKQCAGKKPLGRIIVKLVTDNFRMTFNRLALGERRSASVTVKLTHHSQSDYGFQSMHMNEDFFLINSSLCGEEDLQ